MKSSWRRQLSTVVFMVGVTAVVSSLVSGAHLLTVERVRSNQERYLRRALLMAAGMDAAVAVSEEWEERLREGPAPGMWTILSADGIPVGYVVSERVPGLWGLIKGVVGFDARERRVTGVEFIEHNETPGLGARIDEIEFRRQYLGKRPPFRLAGDHSSASDGEPFDAVTGATITSTAVRNLLNKSGERLEQALRGDAVP